MAELNFSTGVVSHTINGVCEISFNPTDTTFVASLFQAIEDLENAQDEFKKRAAEIEPREIFSLCEENERKMRARLDELFNTSVCDPVFGKTSVTALSDGLPLWANLIFAVIDLVDATTVQQQKLTSPRVAKYLSKYHK